MTSLTNPWERLRQERERLGYSQAAFAAFGGVQKQAQIKYEKGVRKPDTKYLEGIAAAGVDVAYILTGQTASLRAALNDVKVATEAAARIGGTREEVLEYQASIHQGLRAAREREQDEAGLISDYRRCKPPDQVVIRQMTARLAGDAPTESPKKKSRKKT